MSSFILPLDLNQHIFFKRNQFKTRLPKEVLYTKAHQWVYQYQERIYFGLTKFSIRMLGEIVELEFEKKEGETITIGQIVGWVEGFKANSDLYSPVSGTIIQTNLDLYPNPKNLSTDPYTKGWLFSLDSELEPDFLTVEEYADFLNETITSMIEQGYNE